MINPHPRNLEGQKRTEKGGIGNKRDTRERERDGAPGRDVNDVVAGLVREPLVKGLGNRRGSREDKY